MLNSVNASIRKKITMLVVVTIVCLTSISGGLMHWQVSQQLQEIYDAELIDTAHDIQQLIRFLPGFLSQSKHEDAFANDNAKKVLHDYSKQFVVVVKNESNQVVYQSNVQGELASYNLVNGLTEFELDGVSWHGFRLQDSEYNFSVIVFMEQRDRQSFVNQIALESSIPVILLLPIMIAIAMLSFGWLYRPLERVMQELVSKQEGDFTALDPSHYPKEIRGLVQKINTYLTNAGASYQREKHFSADAAHELRTPLAAMKAFLELEFTPQQKQKLLLSTQRMERIVEQLLVLHRIESESYYQLDIEPIEVSELIADVISELLVGADEKSIEFEMKTHQALKVDSDPHLCSLLLSNVLENAVKYAAKSSVITIDVHQNRISISNDIDQNVEFSIHRIWDRFYRGHTSEIAGSGLGLNIVQQIAQVLELKISAKRVANQFIFTIDF